MRLLPGGPNRARRTTESTRRQQRFCHGPAPRVAVAACALAALCLCFFFWTWAAPLTDSTMDALNGNANVYKTANLLVPSVSDNILKLKSAVRITEKRVSAAGLDIFYREARPPDGHFSKGQILLLHGQAFSSANWLDKETLQTLAAAGYHCVAVDLPGYGKTAGNSLTAAEKPELLRALVDALQLDRPALVSPSMSGSYSLPFVMQYERLLSAFIPVAPVGTGEYTSEQYKAVLLPTLAVYGSTDTSLGVSSAANLKQLPNGRLQKIANAGHACYLNNPDAFDAAVVNFLDLVRTHAA